MSENLLARSNSNSAEGFVSVLYVSIAYCTLLSWHMIESRNIVQLKGISHIGELHHIAYIFFKDILDKKGIKVGF
jgi:hypothetical protein